MAHAATNSDQKSLGTFGLWSTYTYNDGNQPVCYMVKTSHFPKSKTFKRGTAYVMITHRPAEGSKDVFSYKSGYNFKPVNDVKVRVGKSEFSLFTDKDTAWSRDTATDHALATAIRNGKSMIVTGVPAKQGITPVTDTLDLKGAAEAYYAIGKACGLDVEVPKAAATPHKKHNK